MSNLLAAIKTRGAEAEVSDIEAEVIGTLSDAPARFTGIEVCITAQSTSPALLGKLMEIADRGCIMMNTLRDKIDIRIRIGSPA